ncbi:hypothetical protein GCM10022219_05780 [Microbacterium oryzae]|uniref:Uncharacterized protein n=1 Tax=Microbacterium oryzae TaxID=743009 RepID=A0A6I6E4G8_9MICO|nr:hypothetical protein [Microbacterium oryzae]QGU26691.1 hypothetical protein D7D94_02675 [Microbacterium oryzae]
MAMFSLLKDFGVLEGVVIPASVATLLERLDPVPGPVGPLPAAGALTIGSALPVALGASLPAGTALDWTLAEEGGDGAKLTLAVAGVDAPVPGLATATVMRQGAGATAREVFTTTGAPLVVNLDGALAVHLSSTGSRVSLENVAVTPSARSVLLPAGFGLTLPASFAIVENVVDLAEMTLVLPAAVPLLGGLALTTALSGAPGAQSLTVTLSQPDPRVSATLTFDLPDVFALSDLVPTVADVALTLPAGAHPLGASGPTIRGAVTVRAVLTRPPAAPDEVTIAVTAQSDQPDGLVSGGGTSPGEIALGITFVLGPAIAAQLGAMAPASLAALYGAASALGGAVATRGDYALDSVTLQAAPASGVLAVSLDISGGIRFTTMDLGIAEISMDADRPMRVRWRGIAATIDLDALTGGADAASALDIDFRTARCDVVDPGGWQITTPAIPKDILQIVGTRSGSGSTWVEVDLRFAMDLGPVKISGATVRGTWDGGSPTFGVRGFDARLDLPGVVVGGGRFELGGDVGNDGIAVSLWGTLVPLNVGGFLVFGLRKAGGVTQYAFGMGLDLPAAIPLGPTGLGVYSIAASFGANAAMTPLTPEPGQTADPLKKLRAWKPWNGLDVAEGQVTIGAGVVIGTVPDGGLTFNALGVLGVTVPDFALRLGVNAQLFRAARQTMAALEAGGADVAPGTGLSLLGGVSATSSELLVGVEGRYTVPFVVDVRLPIAARYAFGDASAWYLRAGSDEGIGAHPSRPPGPLQARVFPGLGPLETTGWAFLMVSGEGIPSVAGQSISPQGFAIALGAGFSKTFGVRGVLWASVSTSLIAAIGTRPVMVWADGRLSGEVGIGPFTLGVDALLQVQIGPDSRLDFHLRVCAEVDLWFTTLEGCIELGAVDPAAAAPIEPGADDWPWPRIDLADGLGHVLPDARPLVPNLGAEGAAPAPAGPAAPASWSAAPTVWTDTTPLLTFPIAPIPEAGVPGENGATNGGRSGAGTTTFEWRLTAVTLEPVDADGDLAGAAVDLTRSAWQPALGLPADAAAISSARQLALLTRARWLSFVHAGERAAVEDAVRGAVGLCGLTFSAGWAWTYGVDARRSPASGSWHVARRGGLAAFSPFSSFAHGVGFRIEAPTRETTWGQSSVDWSEGPIGYAEEMPVSVPAGGAGEDESFVGAFRTRSPRWVALPYEGGETTYRILLDEPADAGDLVLAVQLLGQEAPRGIERLRRSLRASVHTEDGGTEAVAGIRVEPSPAGDATEADAVVILELPSRRRVTAVSWTLTWAASVDVIGLYACSSADAAAAAAAEDGRNASAGADATEATPGKDVSALRTVLAPGTRYRLSVALAWTRLTDDGSGAPPDREDGTARTATWFFRTAPVPPAGAAPITVWKSSIGGGPLASFAVDTFKVEYLDRYLVGYSVADHERFVFTRDRPSARFRAPHVRALASTYGRDLGLLLKPTDRPGPPLYRRPEIIGLYGALAPPFADPVAAASAASACPLPPREAEAVWPAALQPSTPYDLSVALPPKGKRATSASAQLRGITFVTSAFAGPAELVASLGFTRSTSTKAIAAASASGHLPVTPAPALAAGLSTDDDELEAAISALDLPPLRVPEPDSGGAPSRGRSSLLWARLPDGAWAVSGLLLEASEPLVRQAGARMDVQEAVYFRTDSVAVPLPIRRRDRTGTRALWLLATPIAPTAPRALRLRVTDRGSGFWMRITVPVAPAFASSAIVGRSRP